MRAGERRSTGTDYKPTPRVRRAVTVGRGGTVLAVCGICGLLRPAEAGPDDVAIVRAAGDAIRHRGPDHGATAPLGRCTLGYRRLSVIDLATGDQPVANEDGSVVAVFNGEIYNYRRRCAPSSRDRATSCAAPATRRRCPTSTSSTAMRSSSTSTACSPWRSGTHPAASRPRARPVRQEAAPLDAAPGRHGRVCLGAEGAADVPGSSPAGRARAPRCVPGPRLRPGRPHRACTGSTGCRPVHARRRERHRHGEPLLAARGEAAAAER